MLDAYEDPKGFYAADGWCFFCDAEDSLWAVFLRNPTPTSHQGGVSTHAAVCERCMTLVDGGDRSALSTISAQNECCRYYRIPGEEWVNIFDAKRSSEFASRPQVYAGLLPTHDETGG